MPDQPPRRLPRQREEARAKKEARPVSTKGLTRGMKVVFGLAGFVGVLSLVLLQCSDRGKPGKAAVHWNSPPAADRTAPLADLRATAFARAGKVVPDARLARISARRIDADGKVDLEYGGAAFDFVAPPGAVLPAGTPCGVEMAMTWQGWQTRVHAACPDVEIAPRCSVAAAYAKAFPGGGGPVEMVLEGGAHPQWTFWPLEPAGKAVEIADDCPAQSM